jgi:hypothetical protein
MISPAPTVSPGYLVSVRACSAGTGLPTPAIGARPPGSPSWLRRAASYRRLDIRHNAGDGPVPARPGAETMRVLVAMLLLGLQVGQKAIYG